MSNRELEQIRQTILRVAEKFGAFPSIKKRAKFLMFNMKLNERNIPIRFGLN